MLTELVTGVGADTSCTAAPQEAYDDGLYTGLYQVFDACGETTAALATIVASPESGELIIFVAVALVTDADYEALDRIIQSFRLVQ